MDTALSPLFPSSLPQVQRPAVLELVSKDLYVLRRAAEVYQPGDRAAPSLPASEFGRHIPQIPQRRRCGVVLCGVVPPTWTSAHPRHFQTFCGKMSCPGFYVSVDLGQGEEGGSDPSPVAEVLGGRTALEPKEISSRTLCAREVMFLPKRFCQFVGKRARKHSFWPFLKSSWEKKSDALRRVYFPGPGPSPSPHLMACLCAVCFSRV